MVDLGLKAIMAPELMLLIALLCCFLIIVNAIIIIVINIAVFIEALSLVLYMDYII